MDKKLFNKTSNFFKKEGFYVILFVCLCIVATVAAVTSRTAKKNEKPPVVNEQASNDKTTTGLIAEEPTVKYPDALEVKKDPKTTSKTQASTDTKKASSTAVSSTNSTTFVKPVEGTVAREYSEDPVWSDTTNTYRPNFGIDIKADLGKDVVAALDGKVSEVGDSKQGYGMEVVIDHQNGLKTVYSNLDNNVLVTKGKTVKKGDKIGKIGNTTLRTSYEKYGSHLHFAVLKGKVFVDPARYVKYSKAEATEQ
jgi:murein DD-endopeptidase MepM/ murein hydrolase activator NlpD